MGKYIHGKYNSQEDCAKIVRKVKIFADGMTWDSNNLKCYAEYGDPKINSDFYFLKSCQF